MHIQIETKSRWKFTITSPNHNKTVQHCAIPHSIQDSKPTEPIHHRFTESSCLSLKVEHLLEAICIAPSDQLIPRRRRSLRKTFRRFLNHLARMQTDEICYAHHHSGEALPPYPMMELGGDDLESLFELPGQGLKIAHEILGDECSAELDGENLDIFDRYDSFQPTSIYRMADDMMPALFEHTGKSFGTSADFVQQRMSISVPAPNCLASPIIEPSLPANPGSISSGHSHKSSPISPATPQIDGSLATLQRHGSDYIYDTVSPQDYSWSPSRYAAQHLGMSDIQHHYSRPSYANSSSEGFDRVSSSTTDISRRNPGEQCQILSHGNAPSLGRQDYQNSVAFSFRHQPRFDSAEALPLAQERDFDLGQRLSQNCLSRINADTDNQLRPDDIALTEQQEQVNRRKRLTNPTGWGISKANEEEREDIPPVVCIQCGKNFNGRYRNGNLRRHALAFHSLSKKQGNACRVCNNMYNRADATRKHEWKKHRLLDAKPNKRRTS